MLKIRHIITVGMLSSLLSGCVTQNYENNEDTPRVENTSTNNEIAMTRISLGMGYLNMGNTTQAKLNLEKAKRYAPNLTQVYTAFAQYFDVVDEPEQAIEAFERALSLDEDDADTLNNYGVFLCKRERYDESENILLKAIAIPSYLLVSQSYENLATCQLEYNKFEKAEMYLAKSISHSPGRASSLLQMLRLQYAMGNYSEAVEYLRRYEKSTRRFTPNALALAYKVYEKMHNRRIAKNYAGLLVKMFPNSYEAKQYILNGLQYIEADDLAEKFFAVNSQNSNKPKKRVMVLSPNKKSGISIASDSKTPQKPKVVESEGKSVENKVAEQNDEANQTVKQQVKKELSQHTEVDEDTNTSEITEKAELETLELMPEDSSNTGIAQASTDDDGNKMLTLPIHVIEKGDSLYSISKQHNIKMYLIERWNGFKRSKVLKIGDVIYLADPKKAVKH
ncbi:type IV pilus biogenesis/stability protein PilW [Pseudocolwellia sp. HL-MZ19]|uniref:type IV pilus biogenesis/stability protein PilW n=1 Tax=Pseudocolwellia sp. HL-MZ19 TaxID=3400846 RepID=UPI003CE6EA72